MLITSHLLAPIASRQSRTIGNAWFTHTNHSFSTLKLVTTRYKFCCFRLTNSTGKLYPVKPFRIILSFSNLSISFCISGFWSSQMLYGHTKKGFSSLNLSFTSKYGHVPISSLILKAAVFSSINLISHSFSAVVRMLLSKGTYSVKFPHQSFFVLDSQGLAMDMGPHHLPHLLYVALEFETCLFLSLLVTMGLH